MVWRCTIFLSRGGSGNKTVVWVQLRYRIAGNFCRDFNLANWWIFLLNRQNNFRQTRELVRVNVTSIFTHIIMRNRVMCGAHVFAKLKFANNIFRPSSPTLMPAKITGYTVFQMQLVWHSKAQSHSVCIWDNTWVASTVTDLLWQVQNRSVSEIQPLWRLE